MMIKNNGWNKCMLGDVAKIQTGPFGSQLKNNQYITGGTPVITVEHIVDFRINDFNYPSVNDNDKQRLSKYLLKTGDIVFTRVGSVDLSAYVKPHQNGWMFSYRMLRVRPGDVINSRFLSFFFQQTSFREYILNVSVGATMPSINTKILTEIPISYPLLPEQRAIAEILSSIDDKIELNNQMNRTLEATAQAIFKQWFVNYEFPTSINEGLEPFASSGGRMVESELGLIPERWSVGVLGDIVEITSGKRPKEISDIETSICRYPLIGASKIMGYVSEWLFDERILVIGRVGTHGVIQRFGLPTWPSDNTLVFKSDYYNYSYQILSNVNYSELNRGSTQPLITQKDMKNIKILIPEKDCLVFYETVTNSIFDKINQNNKQSQTLSTLRDSLLPKLMSGELRVPEEIVKGFTE